jgi:hypothetical protein
VKGGVENAAEEEEEEGEEDEGELSVKNVDELDGMVDEIAADEVDVEAREQVGGVAVYSG